MTEVDAQALPAGGSQATWRALADAVDSRAIVLVEGFSDQLAVETLARRRGRDLQRERVSIVPIGGAQAIARFLARFAEGSDVRLAGLCDEGEEHVFRDGLEHVGLGRRLTRAGMERLGFYVCVADLEDELIRALGPDEVERIVELHGDLPPFRTFQKQLVWREQSLDRQLKRFLCSADRRKLRYARFLVEALELDRVPRPLDAMLAHV